jgi:hypothetical protein
MGGDTARLSQGHGLRGTGQIVAGKPAGRHGQASIRIEAEFSSGSLYPLHPIPLFYPDGH